MKYSYTTKGTCSRRIDLEIEDGVIKDVYFDGGCPGNTAGVALLARGRGVEDVMKSLRGVRCGMKPTSCPDQLSIALEQALTAAEADGLISNGKICNY